jgi:hypothetical protein
MKKVFVGLMATIMTLLSTTFSVSTSPVRAEEQSFTPKQDVVLCDFEEWKPDFSTIRIGGNFGRVTRSEEFVSSGKYSAKLQPGGPYDSSTPYFTVPLTSKLYGYKYIMSDYSAITAKFYNKQQEDIAMFMGLSFTSYGNKMPVKYTLKPGWNDITYMINHNIIQMFNGSMEGVVAVFFQFEPSLSKDINDSNVIYADDIILRGAQTPIEVYDLVKLSPLEICDFERPYQEYVMSSWVYQSLAPDYKIVDIREGELPAGIIPTSGNCCLKITMHSRTDGYQAYPQAIITENVVAKAINSLTEEEKQRAYIVFDIYAYTTHFTFDLGFKDSVTGGMHSLEPNDSVFYTTPSYKGAWTTYKYKLTDIDQPRENGRWAKSDFVNNPKEIRFIWADFFDGEDRVVYLDNVHIELAEE